MSADTYSIQPFSSPANDLAASAASASSSIASGNVTSVSPSSGGHHWWKYLLILAILGFLMLLLFVYFARKYIPDLSLVFELLGAYAGAKPLDKNTTTASPVQPKVADTQTASTDYKKQDESATEDPKLVIAKPQRGNVYVPEPMPDEAGSRTQSTKATSKAGFCYIGEDRGFRSCIKVGESDKCMSGDIFPTEAICINPNLRE